jgi:hypothetical protein
VSGPYEDLAADLVAEDDCLVVPGHVHDADGREHLGVVVAAASMSLVQGRVGRGRRCRRITADADVRP